MAEAEKGAPMIARQFYELDANKDGQVSLKEYEDFHKQQYEKLKKKRAQALDRLEKQFKKADSNHDGMLNMAEAEKGMPELAKCFTNHDGMISLEEAKATVPMHPDMGHGDGGGMMMKGPYGHGDGMWGHGHGHNGHGIPPPGADGQGRRAAFQCASASTGRHVVIAIPPLRSIQSSCHQPIPKCSRPVNRPFRGGFFMLIAWEGAPYSRFLSYPLVSSASRLSGKRRSDEKL